MKINLNTIDTEMFVMRPVEIAGETCYLIFPKHIGVKWTKQNLIFRSSIWNSDGELVSAGFPKFGNLGENPDVFGYPKSLKNSSVVTKLDGSLLIVSKYNGELIIRTRGTSDATVLDNGDEIEILRNKYPKVFSNRHWDDNWSLLFEWLSPTNRIVIKHDEVDIKLIGAIDHSDYKLLSQNALEDLAYELSVYRPKRYSFGNIDELVAEVSDWKEDEGVVIYTADDRIYKAKAELYLAKHRMKDELCNFKRVVEYYFAKGMPDYQEFYDSVERDIDWETAEEIRGEISKIVDGMKEVRKIVEHMKNFVEPLKQHTRRIAANEIKQAYGNTNRASFAFSLLDSRSLTDDQMQKLLYQVLEK